MSFQPDELPREFADAFEERRQRLGFLASRILYFSSIGSTNDVAARLAASGEHGAVVIADAQTTGRGRRGRRWFSPPGSGLYVSVVFDLSRARASRERVNALITLAAGVAIAEGIERATGLSPDIKWPNDLLVGRRKLAGILAEGTIDEAAGGLHLVLGYGVNVRPSAYPAELRDRATSVETELGKPVDRAALCVETLAALAEHSADLMAGGFDAILDRWRSRSPGASGARVRWQAPSGELHGVTAGIDQWGALLVKTPAGVERLVAGEVTWL